MPLRVTKSGAVVSKPSRAKPVARRSSSSPLATLARTKPAALRAAQAAEKQLKDESSSADDADELDFELDDLGLVSHLETDASLRDVAQYARWIQDHMFDDIPPRAGMNSTRIAEVLNYRKNLPPIVTRAHIHALCKSPTRTEREIAELIAAGVIRKVEISGRGSAQHQVGECLVLTEQWVALVRAAKGVSSEAKEKYIRLLDESRGEMSVAAHRFSREEATTLAQAGFLTSASMLNTGTDLRPDSSTLGSLLSLAAAGSRSVSGTLDAVGGKAAIHDVGGGGTGRSITGLSSDSAVMKFVVPSVGPFLKLLSGARDHLVALLSRIKYRQAPVSLLRERWDVATTDARGPAARRTVGLAGSVLPARTKKWKAFYGLRFQWVLEECLGSGLVEVFETGGVGLGVRLAGP